MGGERNYNAHLRMRDLLGDIRVYSPDIGLWENLRIFGEIIENRRSHICCTVFKYLFIIGGMNSFNKYLNTV